MIVKCLRKKYQHVSLVFENAWYSSAMNSRTVELTQTALFKIAVDGINFGGSLQKTRSLNCLLDFFVCCSHNWC